MSRTDPAESATAAPVAVAASADGPRDLATRWALLPLRLFLGVTFCYAGIDKLADPSFLSASGPGSLGALLRGVHDTAGAGGWSASRCTRPPGSGTRSLWASLPSVWARSSACGRGSPRSAARCSP